jgi:Mn2+/Fe2+ NRAMP family transporter
VDKTSRERDEQLLIDSEGAGFGAKMGAYFKLSGPGVLQSAITLGGGSLAGALFLGVIGGVDLLWVQLFAMIMGAVMLGAISYVTLTTGQSPFKLIKEHVNPVLAWGWILATLMANMVWVLPQYSLAYGAITENLLPGVFADPDEMSTRFMVSAAIWIVVTGITLLYGKSGKGIKIYETALKVAVAGIVICFVAVAIKLLTVSSGISFGQIFAGFVPKLSHLSEPGDAYQAALAAIQNAEVRDYWAAEIVKQQRMNMVGAASAAVGINMTFLLPFSLLNKGWNKNFRSFALFDLGGSLVLPFVLATSCIVIAASVMFHGQPHEDIFEKDATGAYVLTQEAIAVEGGLQVQYQGSLTKRNEAIPAAISAEEQLVAAMVLKRDNRQFAVSLSELMGAGFAQIVFGLGVLAMGLSTSSLLMLISGYVVCEAFGFEHGGKQHKWGTLLASTGLLWPILWKGESKAYLAVMTSTIGYILLPIAFLTFFLLMNSKRVLGEDDMPKGGKRVMWNVLMGVSFLVTGAAAAWTATTKTIGDDKFPIGTYGLITFVVLVIIGQLMMMKKHKSE